MPDKTCPIKKSMMKADVSNPSTGQKWLYTDEVKKHFFHPKNLLDDESKIKEKDFNGKGVVGSPACGDVMKLWIKVDPKTDRIKKCKWQTFGCASAIASTSAMSIMVTEKGGMKLNKALKLTPQDIIKRLGGLPMRKIHCSVLGDKALIKAINDYFRKTEQFKRIKVENSKIVDPDTRVTEKDIEEVVLEGAKTLEDLQKKLKVGIGHPRISKKVEKLMKKYLDKYYG